MWVATCSCVNQNISHKSNVKIEVIHSEHSLPTFNSLFVLHSFSQKLHFRHLKLWTFRMCVANILRLGYVFGHCAHEKTCPSSLCTSMCCFKMRIFLYELPHIWQCSRGCLMLLCAGKCFLSSAIDE